MILVINTIYRDRIILNVVDKSKHHIFEFASLNQSDDILLKISDILTNNNYSLIDIESILVHEGPGSYTGTRVGITVANALAWGLNKPILSYNDNNLKQIIDEIQQKQNYSKATLPKY